MRILRLSSALRSGASALLLALVAIVSTAQEPAPTPSLLACSSTTCRDTNPNDCLVAKCLTVRVAVGCPQGSEARYDLAAKARSIYSSGS